MARIGRNDPCPCGSGKKYKKCCLPKENQRRGREMAVERAVPTVLASLIKAHGKVTEPYLLETYFAGYGEEIFERVEDAPPEQVQMMIANANEWLLAEGELELSGETVPAMGVAMELAGSDLADDQRQWLEAVALEPLDLWEVVEEDGEGEGEPATDLVLRSLTRPDEAPRTLPGHDFAGLPGGTRLGLRVVPWDGGHRTTMALYAFPEPEPGDEEAPTEGIDSLEIVARWLEAFAGPPGAPDLAEAAGVPFDAEVAEPEVSAAEAGEPATVDPEAAGDDVLVTDRYEVRDLDAVLELFASDESVRGSREEGWHLPRDPDAPQGEDQATAGFRLDDDGHLVVFAHSTADADKGQDWLLEEVGGAVRFAGRETTPA
jgi:hypothetical protein